MEDETPLRIAWAAETPAAKQRLTINELDKHAGAIHRVDDYSRETRRITTKKMNTLLMMVVTAVLALAANLVVLLLTR